MDNRPHTKPLGRLIESTDFGPLLQEAAVVVFDEKRLEQNRARLLTRLAAEPVRQTARWFPFPLLSQRPIAWATFAVLLLMSTGAAAVFYWNRYAAPSSGDDFIKDTKETPHSKTLGHDVRNFVSLRREDDLPLPQLGKESAMDAGFATEVNSMDRGRQVRDKESTFNEQVRLFSKAKALLASKDLDASLEYLDRLKQRYPAGPLTFEAKELTAQVLAESHRYSEASQTVSSLIRAKIPTRKKAQLYRFLGDLQLKQHRCDSAVESYRTALGLGLSGAESDAAKAGIKTCIP